MNNSINTRQRTKVGEYQPADLLYVTTIYLFDFSY